ncbi:MAG: N-acetylmuramoyl-L-alanine amidase [Muribaculaceae bacterium]|nr:N-acetylmuramoyl-L-alanine amidase [Muribaculaceae bacterium]
MKQQRLALILAGAAVLCAPAASARLQLRVYSGAADTAYNAEHTIVAVTEPGATATIDGEAVKVYPNTGSFGAKVQLKPGMNKIEIAARKGSDKAKETLNIFLAEKPAKKSTATIADGNKEVTFAQPITVATDSGAYLQYGPAGDRLGGSKMCFLDSAITLRAVGESGSLYRVQLSANRFAYLPKEYAHAAAQAAPALNVTGSWSITRGEKNDRVSIALPARLPYDYWTEDGDPSTLCVEIYGACDNSNWITQRSLDPGIIDRVDFRQIESDVYRVLIHLKSRYVWGFTVGYEGTAMRIDVRHAPASDVLKGLHVGIDAGHGGKYPGAKSPAGLVEKELNLDIVLKLRDMLEKAGARVTLTRSGDTGPSMTERKRTLRDAGVDISVSVHNNAGGSPLSAPGTAALYKHSFDREFALAVARRLLELDVNLFGLVGNFNFSLNGPTDYPNMLVEGLFMSSLEEENLLADPDFRTRMARAIFLGLEDYMRTAQGK